MILEQLYDDLERWDRIIKETQQEAHSIDNPYMTNRLQKKVFRYQYLADQVWYAIWGIGYALNGGNENPSEPWERHPAIVPPDGAVNYTRLSANYD